MSRLAGGLVTALAAAVVLTGCGAGGGGDRPLVVVTTNILGDVVGELVGDQAEVLTLMPAGADPHSFEVSAREAAQMREADLLVANGLGLEEGVLAQVEAAREDGVVVVEAGDAVQTVEWTTEDDTGVDPHFWTDPAQVRAVVDSVSAAVAEHVDGIDGDRLATDTVAYRTELEDLDAWMVEQLGQVPEPRRNLVTNHHVFGYLADRFGFTVVGAVIPSGSTLASPSARDLDELAGAIRDAGVSTLFADSSQSDRLVQVLAEQAGLDVAVVPLFTESLTPPGGGAETYLQMMRANTEDIVEGLR
ncbi:zinc ABC transporter substrate-binding protein AztC [Klenkia taihuensis]|uniref:Zinc/manganese transport system substrate-binding protein n=1 Tax=Klenkia taihuensis TaxID=1225127 RepID=A0A1I1TYW5_9ACTN|nr:zinc ABC transporter substrate-binding protein AztC [Klenkia taihuensis]GHE07059.1 ABC transporter substrate-binding protein [Klenkia taihuensis]SFD63792.1 zinc/manganese transport system substrate-binding protein [Klenkia taihuensis]